MKSILGFIEENILKVLVILFFGVPGVLLIFSMYIAIRDIKTPTKSVEDWAVHYALEEHLETYEDDFYVTYIVRSAERILGNFDGDITYRFVIVFETEKHEYTSYIVIISYDDTRDGTKIQISERSIKYLDVTFRQRSG